jgi:alkylation response protein AidB-like acyl-CoA dehydrogenase
MASFLDDNADLRYYLERGIDWAALAALGEAGFRQPDGFKSAEEAGVFYREVAALVGAFAADEVAPHAAEIDRAGVRFVGGEAQFPPRLAGIFDKLGALGLHGLTVPRELGGMNAPLLLYYVCGELLGRADASVMVHNGFHGAIAMAMLVLSMLEGTTELDPVTGRVLATRWRDEIAEIAAGRAWGSMDITEPDAGSDMAALRATARRDAAGRWTITGQKIFITSGHGKYHFVIARTGTAAAGLDGLSMFLVRAFRDEPDGRRVRTVAIDRLEEKMGQHASATAALRFDETPAELVGQPGSGFRQMLELINHARIGVGFESIGLCEAALHLARDYAAQRRSMGRTIDRHELIADYLDEMEIDVIGLRALAMHAAFEDEIGHKKRVFGRFLPGADTAQLAREAQRHHAAARRATPLLKYLAAEKAVELSRRCMQIHGGIGYMRELGAEKLVRDALVMPIYEGTSQIQALMATKDALTGIMRAPQELLKRHAQARWRALSAREGLQRQVARLQQLSLSAQQHVATRTMTDKVRATRGEPLARWPGAVFKSWNPRRDFTFALLHAERLTRLLADEEIAVILAGQARRDPERRSLLERHLERALPRARFLHDEITTTGSGLLSRLAARRPDDGAGDQKGDGERGDVGGEAGGAGDAGTVAAAE